MQKYLETPQLSNFEMNREGLKPHLMAQPLGYHTPDAARCDLCSCKLFSTASGDLVVGGVRDIYI